MGALSRFALRSWTGSSTWSARAMCCCGSVATTASSTTFFVERGIVVARAAAVKSEATIFATVGPTGLSSSALFVALGSAATGCRAFTAGSDLSCSEREVPALGPSEGGSRRVPCTGCTSAAWSSAARRWAGEADANWTRKL